MKAYERRTLKHIKGLLPKIMPPRARVILYGSRARGDARPDSNWDILVVLDKPELAYEDFDNACFPLVELGWDLRQDIKPIIYARPDWEDMPGRPFYQNVITDGITLYDGTDGH